MGDAAGRTVFSPRDGFRQMFRQMLAIVKERDLEGSRADGLMRPHGLGEASCSEDRPGVKRLRAAFRPGPGELPVRPLLTASSHGIGN